MKLYWRVKIDGKWTYKPATVFRQKAVRTGNDTEMMTTVREYRPWKEEE